MLTNKLKEPWRLERAPMLQFIISLASFLALHRWAIHIPLWPLQSEVYSLEYGSRGVGCDHEALGRGLGRTSDSHRQAVLSFGRKLSTSRVSQTPPSVCSSSRRSRPTHSELPNSKRPTVFQLRSTNGDPSDTLVTAAE